jgi:hypothetical protein
MMQKNQELVDLINNSPILNEGDKDFIVSKLDELSPLDKLKLQTNLTNNVAPELLNTINTMRMAFFKQETPPKPDFISKFVQKVSPPKPKKVVSHSILNQPAYLGGYLPKALSVPRVNLPNLNEFHNLNELNSLTPLHITFGLNDNAEQTLNNFYQKLDELFSEVVDIHMKRAYFMMFLQSPLYITYTDTGLTALRHPEITPSSIILNRLQQIHPKYLNTKQFQIASKICAHIRMLCGV